MTRARDLSKFIVTSGTTANRPSSPTQGQLYFDTTLALMLNYQTTTNAWVATGTGPPVLSGGTLTSDATYYYRTFTASGTLTLTGSALTADILVVAGGGSGAADDAQFWGGGGGGAGGLLEFTSQTLSPSSYTCTVGAGGSGTVASPTNGSNSQFAALTATVGGGFGRGQVGGSGGGSSPRFGSGGAGTSGQGNAGGTNGSSNAGAGGGGKGAAGVGPTVNNGSGGAGGNGVSTYSSWLSVAGVGQNISGTYWIAGGGGGGGIPYYGTPVIAQGGNGGGGAGAAGGVGVVGTSGTANTGGGGGGSGGNSTQASGAGNPGSGGSGVIIVRYTKALVGG